MLQPEATCCLEVVENTCDGHYLTSINRGQRLRSRP